MIHSVHLLGSADVRCSQAMLTKCAAGQPQPPFPQEAHRCGPLTSSPVHPGRAMREPTQDRSTRCTTLGQDEEKLSRFHRHHIDAPLARRSIKMTHVVCPFRRGRRYITAKEVLVDMSIVMMWAFCPVRSLNTKGCPIKGLSQASGGCWNLRNSIY